MLTNKTLDKACHELGVADPMLRKLLDQNGRPPLWDRPAGFPSLVRIILEQQVSLASGAAVYARLAAAAGAVSPTAVIKLGESAMREAGLTRQKAAYCMGLAQSIQDGRLNLSGFENDSDESVLDQLQSVKGIGPWTAEVYLLMVLLRPDIWPSGDLALNIALQDVLGLDKRPIAAESAEIANRWAPWRSVAARILWHHYLNRSK